MGIPTDRIKKSLQDGLDAVFSYIPAAPPPGLGSTRPWVVAHRGVHEETGYCENTLKAFRAAQSYGVDAVELDIRWTQDLIPIVHHDTSCERTFGKPVKISDETFLSLRRKIPQIPTLEEVIQELGGSVHLMIELKEEPVTHLNRQKDILTEILKPLTPTTHYHLLSLSENVFYQFDHMTKEAYVIISEFNPDKMSRLAREHHWGGWAGHYLLMPKKLIEEQRQAGRKVGSGFIHNRHTLYRELHRGLDWLFTNRPLLLSSLLKEVIEAQTAQQSSKSM